MFSTKTRTAILTLVASLSFAGATVAPAVSQARPKAIETKTPKRLACNALVDSIQQAEQDARNYEKAGDTKNAEASWTAANLYFDVWSEQGCASADVAISVRRPPARIAPVGAAGPKA
jgi:hypothetical protein